MKRWRQFSFVIIAFGLIGVIVWLIYLHFAKGLGWADWTGLGEYTSPTGEHQPAKTLWNWMELLIVPVALALGAWLLNRNERETEREIARQREAVEREIALDRQRQEILEAYFDRMTELLLDRGLRDSGENDEVRSMARTRTLAVLRSLDGERKGQALQFLREANLISLVSLENADLRGANLHGVDLEGAILRGAKLCQADLSRANLFRADLQKADLTQANLTEANLRAVNLLIADLRHTTLVKVNLGDANASGSDMSMADLSQSSLIGTNVSGANLSGVNLSKTNLSAAKLGDVNLQDANLTGAFLRDVDLRKVKGITPEQLAAVKSLEGATMPECL